jgi:DNA helicase-2/ATP-dependent DNA helicase PcrA
MQAAMRIAAQAWPAMRFDRGDRTWRNAAVTLTASLAGKSTVAGRLDDVAAELARHQMGILVNHDTGAQGLIQVMNLHQTKGREVDATILCCKNDDYFGNEREPYTDNSRLLYVVLTRARQTATILLPERPHGLVAPLMRCSEATVGQAELPVS